MTYARRNRTRSSRPWAFSRLRSRLAPRSLGMVDEESAGNPRLAPARASSSFGRQALVRWVRRYAIFLILAALIILFETEQPAFLRLDNLFSVLQAVSVVALL